MSAEVFELATANVTRWTLAEMVKAATAKAKNDLETYIINTREKLETDELYQQVRLIRTLRVRGREKAVRIEVAMPHVDTLVTLLDGREACSMVDVCSDRESTH
jgi:hypothetical protein